MTDELIHDITRDANGALRLPPEELARFVQLGISVSDTETTGLNRERNGLTEIASIRGVHTDGEDRLKLFHSFILPLKPAYKDYLHQCEDAKAKGKEPPLYDRRLYEYIIEPGALAVTGTQIIRKRKDGPITGLKLDGKSVPARPFYEVMEDFLIFTQGGDNDVYYNAPFDRPLLGIQIADVRAHAIALSNIHTDLPLHKDARLSKSVRDMLKEYARTPYEALLPRQQQQITAALNAFVDIPASYTNPALYQCLYYGFLAKCGFGPSNTLDDALRALVDVGHGKRGDHSGIEDVVMAARVGLRLADPGIADMRGLYETLLKKVDPQGHAETLTMRKHRNGKEAVEGDIALQFSRPLIELGKDAQRFWQFLAAFKEAPRINSRVPQHVLTLDHTQSRVVINAERKQPLSLNFLKKCIFFTQLLNSPVLYSMLPYDSTGNRIDVVLHEIDPNTGERQLIEDVHYGSLRANVTFLEAHPAEAAVYLRLISRLRKTDRSVGMVLLREREGGAVDIVVKGHLRAFGECVMRVPAGVDIARALPALESELATQIKLGVIPQVGNYGEAEESSAQEDEDNDSLSTDPSKDRHEDKHSSAFVTSHVDEASRRMSLTLSDIAFACIASRLGKTGAQLLEKGGLTTANGTINLSRTPENLVQLRGPVDAFYDFIEMNSAGEVAEKPSNMIRDASWLLYRLERLPGTYALKIEGDMAVLDQRDGISVEALGLLYHIGIPFKGYGEQIKVDVHQLMKNAFHWSLALSRAQKERKEQMDAALEGRSSSEKGYQEPQRFLLSVQQALLSGKAQAIEMNERRDCWLLDHSAAPGEAPVHHPLMKNANGINLVFKGKALTPELSDIKGPHALRIFTRNDGSAVVHTSPLLLALAASRLASKHIDANAFAMSITNGWNIPQEQRKRVIPALHEASRFLYWLGKQTGSERMAAENAELSDDGRVLFYVPHLHFLGNPQVHNEALQASTAFSDPVVGRQTRSLERGLPNPKKEDMRHGDVSRMTAESLAQLDAIEILNDKLNTYLRLLGGAEHAGDPGMLVFADMLRVDLATLGTLLHELATTSRKEKFVPEVWDAIHVAQEKISAVTFGNAQLCEDLAVVRKALTGGADNEGGLRSEIGHAIGTLLLDATLALARSAPEAFSASSMETYHRRMHDLLGEQNIVEHAYYMRHAAMRYLVSLPNMHDPLSLQDRLAHHFLQHAFPHHSESQRNALIKLYREGSTPENTTQIRFQFLAHERKRHANGPTQGELLLQQHHLLTHPHEIDVTIEQWQVLYPQTKGEADINAAYQRRGKLYLEMAYLINPHREDAPERRAFYLERAEHCLLRAGWSPEKFLKVKESTSKRNLSDSRKQYVRDQMKLKYDPDQATLAELVATIDHEGHEDKIRQDRAERAYKAYQHECKRLCEDILDPYYIHKQRVALLGRIEKALKETHDLKMVQYHHVRDLQGLLMLLQQDPSVAERMTEEKPGAIGEIGRTVKPIPELAGIRDDTVTQIHNAVHGLKESLHRRFMGCLSAHGVAGRIEEDDAISCDMEALKHMFARWHPEKPKLQTPLPDHLYSWFDRASQRLLRVPSVDVVTLDKRARHVECIIRLPHPPARAQVWAELRLATVGLGLHVPAMPQDSGESHVIRLSFLKRVEAGKASMEEPVLLSDRKGEHHFREAIGAFAVKEGLPPAWERSFVSDVMKRRQHPRHLDEPLNKAAAQGINISGLEKVLIRHRQR